MYTPKFELRSFDTVGDAAKSRALIAMLEALIAINEGYLIERPDTPELYASGIPYVEEPVGRDHWQDIPRTLKVRVGDCEDLACWRIAELRVRNAELAARPYVKSTLHNGKVVYHVAVQRADGQLEDPSRILGMRSNT